MTAYEAGWVAFLCLFLLAQPVLVVWAHSRRPGSDHLNDEANHDG